MLRRGGYLREIGEDAVFHAKEHAIAGMFAQLDRSVCARCTARIFRECATLPPPARGQCAPPTIPAAATRSTRTSSRQIATKARSPARTKSGRMRT